jgi:hypothetical protein
MASYARPSTFYFGHELERDEENLEVEVTYSFDGDGVYIDAVEHNGKELLTTPAEDDRLLNIAKERLDEDLESAAADYGDYLYDSRRDGDY